MIGEEQFQLLDDERVVLQLRQSRDADRADHAHGADDHREHAAVGRLAVQVETGILLERTALRAEAGADPQ